MGIKPRSDFQDHRTKNKHDPRVKNLLVAIQCAFQGVRRDNGTSLYASTQLDNQVSPDLIEETQEARTVDPGTNWEGIPAAWLEGFGLNGGWPFIDAKGFRYYLPACMAHYLQATPETSGAWIYESLIHRLCDRDYETMDGGRFVPANYAILTRPQSIAVRRFLEYADSWFFDGDEYGTGQAHLALAGYWKQFA